MILDLRQLFHFCAARISRYWREKARASEVIYTEIHFTKPLRLSLPRSILAISFRRTRADIRFSHFSIFSHDDG